MSGYPEFSPWCWSATTSRGIRVVAGSAAPGPGHSTNVWEIDDAGVVYVTDDGMLLTYPVPEPDVPTLPTSGPR